MSWRTVRSVWLFDLVYAIRLCAIIFTAQFPVHFDHTLVFSYSENLHQWSVELWELLCMNKLLCCSFLMWFIREIKSRPGVAMKCFMSLNECQESNKICIYFSVSMKCNVRVRHYSKNKGYYKSKLSFIQKFQFVGRINDR